MASGVSDRLQEAAIRVAAALLRRLPAVAASNLGGFVARMVGPVLPVSRVADHNLRAALPAYDAPARARIIRGVWDNLGRTAAELPHVAGLRRAAAGPGWEIAGEDHLRGLLARGGPILFFSGHFGNWELILPIAAALGLNVAGVYRPASNRRVDAAIQGLRQAASGGPIAMFPKGAAGARAAIRHLRGGGSLGLLVDQKMNDGIAVDFFGRPAMTAPALAQFARRFNLPIMPVRVERLGPARLRMVCEAPIELPSGLAGAQDIAAIMRMVNVVLERWIRESPGQWLWLHRRWPK